VQSVVDLIRGPIGQPVRLTIQAAGQTTGRTVTIVRGQIQPPNVETRLLPGKIGYLQIYGFPENAASQVKAGLDSLDRQGALAWIVDIRDNGGGSLDAVTQVTSLFVPKGTLLYYLYDGNGQRTDYVADGSIRSHIPPVVVLTNDGSGSGAEIFAAVLREQGVARLVGEKTAGCVGTGQLYPLPSGGGIQVTVAQLLTGRGGVLNRIGASPDVGASMSLQDLVAGHDPQVERAVQLLQTGR
jgi:carboxyl-terminal processing protease